MADLFRTDLIGVFCGRAPTRSREENLALVEEVWSPLTDEIRRAGVVLAFLSVLFDRLKALRTDRYRRVKK